MTTSVREEAPSLTKMTARCGDYGRAKRDRGRIAAILLTAEFPLQSHAARD